MKVSKQLKPVESGFRLSTHQFFNAIAEAVSLKFEKDLGIKLNLTGKSMTKTKINAVLLGQKMVEEPAEMEETNTRVRDAMARLKNPNNLLNLLK